MVSPVPQNVPLTVIGGFLGAGKTTLVNHLLADAANARNKVRYAVLVNDFGDLAIDESLIVAHDGKTIALANGCICCTIGDDLIETIMDLMESPEPPQHLIIEASGVADPRPISELGSLNPHLRRDLTLVVVDAEQVRNQWSDARLRETVDRQLDAANLLVVNKVEDMSENAVQELEAWLETRAPEALRIRSARGHIPFSVFTDSPLDTQIEADQTGHTPDHHHGEVFQTITLDVPSTMTLAAFRQRASALPACVLRAKGHVTLDETCFLFQKVGPRMSIVPVPVPATEKKQQRANQIVLIGPDELPALDWFY